MVNIVIIGSGYVGLVSGACFAEIGHNVVCVDSNAQKISALKKSKIPIYEPNLAKLVQKNSAAGRLKFSTEINLQNADAVFLAVGTPTDPKTQNADMKYFFAAAEQVAKKTKNKIAVISKSTVPVGTAKTLRKIFGKRAEIISNPEFLREGNAIVDFMKPDRIVCGVSSEFSKKLMQKIYAPLNAKILFTKPETSELIKYASNAFLAMKVTFINEMADVCEAVGADVEELAEGMGLDSRIGTKFLQAGPGIGGSCFPKDGRALAVQARNAGVPSKIIEAFILANEARKTNLAKKIAKKIGSGTVAIFGLTFKAGTDDMREAPALTIIPALQKLGLKIKAYDPEGMEEASKILRGVEFCESAVECAKNADGIVILTEWQEFKKINYSKLKPRKKIIIDLRNLLSKTPPKNYDYSGVGKA